MSIKFTILLYSKYSKFSTNIISTVNQYQSIFVENFNMKTLCIDNENIRKRVLNSKKISITCVPSILVIYEDGGVEKYDNNDAFNWVEEIIKRFMFLQKQQETPIPSSNVKEQELYSEEILEEDLEDSTIDIPQPPPKQQVKSRSKSIPKVKHNKNKQEKKQIQSKNNKIPSNKTSIEDLEELELELDEEDIQENFEFKPEPIEQVESTNALSEKRNDLLSLAAEMQKSRDSFVDNTDKPKNIPFDR